MKITGTIVSGTGEAAGFLQRDGYERQFTQKLGYAPFAGTLNVRVVPAQVKEVRVLRKRPGVLIDGFSDGGRKFYPVTIYPAAVGERAVAVIFPEASRYGPDIVEIVSADNLRETLGLKDGDLIEISIE